MSIFLMRRAKNAKSGGKLKKRKQFWNCNQRREYPKPLNDPIIVRINPKVRVAKTGIDICESLIGILWSSLMVNKMIGKNTKAINSIHKKRRAAAIFG